MWSDSGAAGQHAFEAGHQTDPAAVHLDIAGSSRLTGGNLGIGTTPPDVLLHVRASAGDGAKFQFYNDAANFLQIGESSGPRIEFSRPGSASLTFRNSTDGVNLTDRPRSESDGSVRVSTGSLCVGGRPAINSIGQPLYG